MTDKNGIELVQGQRVNVHQEDKITQGVVVDIFECSPTSLQPGCWVDIDRGEGTEGMPSYLLEVLPLDTQG